MLLQVPLLQTVTMANVNIVIRLQMNLESHHNNVPNLLLVHKLVIQDSLVKEDVVMHAMRPVRVAMVQIKINAPYAYLSILRIHQTIASKSFVGIASSSITHNNSAIMEILLNQMVARMTVNRRNIIFAEISSIIILNQIAKSKNLF